MTYLQEIKRDLKEGLNFNNLGSNWFTVNRLKDNCKCICINDKYFTYKNWDSYAKRVKQLLNRGY